ncbi:MAG: hypothetical protein GWP07_05580 [Xanthomonadaceae bacterium]|nr:hypothetical protein [Xanthomonadaceae bacterium]
MASQKPGGLKLLFAFACLGSLLLLPVGCSKNFMGTNTSLGEAVIPTDAKLLTYHLAEHYKALEVFTRRLYAKNPKYEPDVKVREEKIQGIFHGSRLPFPSYRKMPSHEILTEAFAKEPQCSDRVFLLSLGLVKSVRETYQAKDEVLLSSLQVPLENLQKLYRNISQVNWRLKVYRDEDGCLLFCTNEAGDDGYINMGYEVIMTRILTRVTDDIYLRGGSPPKFIFNMSTMFLAIIL